MGGREAIRGFSVQTLICLLDSLNPNEDWAFVTLEPDSSNDKVDILWEDADGSLRAQQVKSSKNQIGKADVVTWCGELKQSHAAKKYQLILAGPVASTVLTEAPFDGVDVPTPVSVDVLALLDQAITKLDRYLDVLHIDSLPLPLRESIVYGLVARMLEASVNGAKMSRQEFEGWLLRGVLSSYPDAIRHRLSANCVVLWSLIEVAAPPTISSGGFELILPITVVNGGAFTAVVEVMFIRIWNERHEMRYASQFVIQGECPTSSGGWRDAAKPFTEFAVMAKSSKELSVAFLPITGSSYHSGTWQQGDYNAELFIKYASQQGLTSVKRVIVKVGADDFAVLNSRNTSFIRVSPPAWEFPIH